LTSHPVRLLRSDELTKKDGNANAAEFRIEPIEREGAMKLLQKPCHRSGHGFSLRWSNRRKLARKIGVAAAILVASAGAVAADECRALPGTPGFFACLEAGRSVAQQDRTHHDSSATVGRMGLGADPAHPEGPGNFSF
jgi:hypothetical protein